MKLIDILEARDFKAYTLQTTIDPETGRSSSKVTYNPIYNVYKSLEQLNSDFDKAAEKLKDDSELLALHKEFNSLKRKIDRHIDQKYK